MHKSKTSYNMKQPLTAYPFDIHPPPLTPPPPHTQTHKQPNPLQTHTHTHQQHCAQLLPQQRDAHRRPQRTHNKINPTTVHQVSLLVPRRPNVATYTGYRMATLWHKQKSHQHGNPQSYSSWKMKQTKEEKKAEKKMSLLTWGIWWHLNWHQMLTYTSANIHV